jgi:hypothetical protein
MRAGAVLRAATAIAVLSLMDAVIKTMAASYPIFQVAFLRFGFGLVVATAALALARPGLPSRETFLANAARAVLTVHHVLLRARRTAASRGSRPHLPLADVRRILRRADARGAA